MSKNNSRNKNKEEEFSIIFGKSYKKNKPTWDLLMLPLYSGCFIFLGWITVVAFFQLLDQRKYIHWVAAFCLLLSSISGIIQIIRKESPGPRYRIIRGKKAIIIGLVWFLLSIGLCGMFIWFAFNSDLYT